jgi:hypothetical protein
MRSPSWTSEPESRGWSRSLAPSAARCGDLIDQPIPERFVGTERSASFEVREHVAEGLPATSRGRDPGEQLVALSVVLTNRSIKVSIRALQPHLLITKNKPSARCGPSLLHRSEQPDRRTHEAPDTGDADLDPDDVKDIDERRGGIHGSSTHGEQ